jgi:hypothetical protein
MTATIGDFSRIYLKEAGSTGGSKIIGCTTGDSITFNTEFLELTPIDDRFVESEPTYKSAEISTDALLITADVGDAQYSTTVLIGWDKASTKLDFVFEWDELGVQKSIDGTAYISSLSINAPSNDFASVQIALKVTGEWDLNF